MSTQDPEADAVMRGLAGVMHCPSCGRVMIAVRFRQEDVVGDFLTEGWHCLWIGCYVVFVNLEGEVVDPPKSSVYARRGL